MNLVITPFANAVDRLREGLHRYERDRTDEQIRDGLIQRLEVTYELSHRMLKRYLEQAAASPESFDQMPFQDLIRTGSEQGLLRSGWPEWRRYRELRSRTSHAYDAKIAQEVVAAIPDFLEEAAFLRAELERRLE
jgi:nucleotidyltransferase substrate binding protein (TIGR01987 family)